MGKMMSWSHVETKQARRGMLCVHNGKGLSPEVHLSHMRSTATEFSENATY